MYKRQVLVLAQWEIPVLGRLLDESMSRVVFVGWVDQLLRRESCTTLLALVAISTLCATTRTSTHDVAVGEELACYLIAELLLNLLLQYALVVEGTEEVRGKLIVSL